MFKDRKRLFTVLAIFTMNIGLALPLGGEIANQLHEDISSSVASYSDDDTYASYDGSTYSVGGGRTEKTTPVKRLEQSSETINVGITTWEEAFPDTNFRVALLTPDTIFQGTYTDATDKTRTISGTEFARITALDTLDVKSKSIANLAGIEHLTGLKWLNVERNALTEIDLSRNTALTYFRCYGNKLVDIDVSMLVNLTELDVGANRELDKMDISKNTKLTSFRASENNITRMDFTANPLLKVIYLWATNSLMEVNISNNYLVEELNFLSSKLSQLDVTHMPNLKSLTVSNNKLTELDLSNNTKLEFLDCSGNKISVLDIANCVDMTSLIVQSNLIQELDISRLTKLQIVNMSDNQLTGSFDFSGRPDLSSLKCSNNMISELIIGSTTALRTLESANNLLTEIELSQARYVSTLSLNNNKLTSLNLAGVNVSSLAVSNNKLTNLVLGSTNSLTKLQCANNKLTTLDLQNYKSLTDIWCSSNNLTTLTIGSTKLANLECQLNDLETLDITATQVLTKLDVSYNKNLDTLLFHEAIKTKVTLLHLQQTALDFDIHDFTALTSVGINDHSQYNVTQKTSFRYSATAGDLEGELRVNSSTGSFSRDEDTDYISSLKSATLYYYLYNPVLNTISALSSINAGTNALVTPEAIVIEKTTMADVQSDGTIVKEQASVIHSLRGSLYTSGGVSVLGHQATFTGDYQVIFNDFNADGRAVRTAKIDYSNPGTLVLDLFTLKTTSSNSTVTYEITDENGPATECGVVEGFASGDTFEEDTVVGLTAIPAEGYTFVGWFIGDVLMSRNEEYTLQVTEDVHLEANFKVFNPHDVNLTYSLSGGGVVVEGSNRPGSYQRNTTITLEVDEANENELFTGWFEVNTLLSREKQYTFTLEKHTTIVAKFKDKAIPPKEDFTFDKRVRLLDGTMDIGGTTTGTGAGTYETGFSISVSATAGPGYTFIGWYIGDVLQGRQISYFRMNLTANTVLDAVFKPKLAGVDEYTFDYSSATPAMGTVSGTIPATYDVGTPVTLTATPIENHKFIAWYNDDDEVISWDHTLSFTLQANFKAKAKFKLIAPDFKLIKEVVGDGWAFGQSSGMYNENTYISISASPKSGNKFVGWYDGNDNLIQREVRITFYIEEDMHLVAKFKKTPPAGVSDYILDLSVKHQDGTLNKGGRIEGTSAGIYDEDTEVSLTAVPNEGYKFVGWYDENDLLISSELTHEFVIEVDTTIYALFKNDVEDFAFTYESSEGGNVSASHSQGIIDIGTNIELTAQPLEGYSFVGWYVEDTLVSRSLVYSFGITAETHILALFKKITVGVPEYTLDYASDDLEMGEVSGTLEGTYDEGTEITLTATAKTGYSFVGWYDGDTLVSRDATYTFEIEANTELVAKFKVITAGVPEYTLDYASDNLEMGEVSGTLEGTYDANTSIALVAIPNEGYKFVGWYDMNNNLISRNAAYSFTIVDNTNLKAVFKLLPPGGSQDYTFDYVIEGQGTISGTRAGTYNDEVLISVTAAPKPNNIFEGWYDGDEFLEGKHTYVFNIKDNTTLIARFKTDNGKDQYRYQYLIIGEGTVTSSLTTGRLYDENSLIALVAKPTTGNSFVGWYDERNLLGSDLNYVHTLRNDIIITARFKVKTAGVDEYRLTYDIEGNGSVDGTIEGLYNNNTHVSLLANPNEGSIFAAWYDQDYNVITWEPEYEFDLTTNTHLIVVFRDMTNTQHKFTYGSGANGSVESDHIESLYAEGTEITLTATPIKDYRVEGWYLNNTRIEGETDNTYTHRLLENSHIEVRFIYTIFEVEVTITGNGSVEGGGRYYENDNVALIATPGADSSFEGWYENGLQIETFILLTIPEISKSHVIEARFIKDKYTIQVDITGSGSVTGHEGYHSHGSDVILTAEANEGHEFVGWYVGETSLSVEPEYTVPSIKKDIVIKAVFRELPPPVIYYVTIAIVGEGTVTGDGGYIEGTNVILEASPDTGWEFVGWYDLDDNLLKTDPYHVISGINRNYDVKVIFIETEIITTYKVSVEIEGNGTVTGTGNHNIGQNVILEAIPDEGWEFIGWYEYGDLLASDNPTYVIPNLYEDVNLRAVFEPLPDSPFEYTISVSITGNGSVSGDGVYEEGSEVNLIATPEEGWEFAGWYDLDNTLLGKGQTYVIEELMSDVELAAKFEEIVIPETHEVEVSVEGDGSVIGMGNYADGEEVILIAVPDEGYEFVGWFDEAGNLLSEDPYYVINELNADIVVKAAFRAIVIITHIVDVNIVGSGTITGAGTYDDGARVILVAVPEVGYDFDGWYNADGNLVSNDLEYTILDLSDDVELTARFRMEIETDSGDIGGTPTWLIWLIVVASAVIVLGFVILIIRLIVKSSKKKEG